MLSKTFKSALRLVILAATYSTTSLWAASLQVSPISVQFDGTDRAKEIWLTNTSSESIRAQTRVLVWTQTQNKDDLQPTKDLVASPVITEIKAGERQLVRVIKTAPQPNHTEQTYRVLVDELPNTQSDKQKTGLQLLLQYSIPVFVASSQDIAVQGGLTSLKDVKFSYQNQKITVKNNANSHVRLSQLTYVNTNGERIELASGLLGYALAHQTMSWDIPQNKNMRANGTFEARINMDGKAQVLPMP